MIYTYYTIVKGIGVSQTKLNAFDQALVNAGIGDYNLVKVSSILPPGCRKRESIDYPKGSILHIAYASFTSNMKNHAICATVGAAVPASDYANGVIMELSDKSLENEEELLNNNQKIITCMLQESFKIRDMQIDTVDLLSSVTSVKNELYHCVFSGIALWS